MTQFHVIDHNYRRRAQISRQLMSRGLHAEIYEDISEFSRVAPDSGVLLASSTAFGRGSGAGEIDIAVALYSEQPATCEVVDAVSTGVIDFLSWPITAEALDRLLERLGTPRHSAAEVRKRRQAQARVKTLSARELEVLILIVQGGSSKSIGDDLGISSRTVEIHRANVTRKLSANSVADAVRIALYAGIDDAPEL